MGTALTILQHIGLLSRAADGLARERDRSPGDRCSRANGVRQTADGLIGCPIMTHLVYLAVLSAVTIVILTSHHFLIENCCFDLQVIELVGLAAGFMEGVPLEAVPSRLEFMAAHVQQRQPALLREITRTRRLTDEQREVSRLAVPGLHHAAPTLHWLAGRGPLNMQAEGV